MFSCCGVSARSVPAAGQRVPRGLRGLPGWTDGPWSTQWSTRCHIDRRISRTIPRSVACVGNGTTSASFSPRCRKPHHPLHLSSRKARDSRGTSPVSSRPPLLPPCRKRRHRTSGRAPASRIPWARSRQRPLVVVPRGEGCGGLKLSSRLRWVRWSRWWDRLAERSCRARRLHSLPSGLPSPLPPHRQPRWQRVRRLPAAWPAWSSAPSESIHPMSRSSASLRITRRAWGVVEPPRARRRRHRRASPRLSLTPSPPK
jgi:hypothetical protein